MAGVRFPEVTVRQPVFDFRQRQGYLTFTAFIPDLEPKKPPIPIGTGKKRPQCETYRSHQSSAEVKNA
jgi:hypothetical protein